MALLIEYVRRLGFIMETATFFEQQRIIMARINRVSDTRILATFKGGATQSKFSKRHDRPAFNRYKMAVVFNENGRRRHVKAAIVLAEGKSDDSVTYHFVLRVVRCPLRKWNEIQPPRGDRQLAKASNGAFANNYTTHDRRPATIGRAASTTRNLYPLESTVPARADWPTVTPCRATIGQPLDRSTHHARPHFSSAEQYSPLTLIRIIIPNKKSTLASF